MPSSMVRTRVSTLAPPDGWRAPRARRPQTCLEKATPVGTRTKAGRRQDHEKVTGKKRRRVKEKAESEEGIQALSTQSDASSADKVIDQRRKTERVLAARSSARRRSLKALDSVEKGSPLEMGAISKGNRQIYVKELDQFLEWLRKSEWTPAVGGDNTEDAEVDAHIVRYMTELWLQGHQASRGERLLCGLVFFSPEWGKLGARKIPRAWQSLKGWRRKCPSRSRRPYPLNAWSAMCWMMAAEEAWQMMVYTMLMLSAYLRPGEGLGIRRGDVIAPGSANTRWSLLLFPEERADRSKTGAKDDSLLLDTPWCPWLPIAMRALREGDAESSLFSFNYRDYVSMFKRMRDKLQIKDLVPYQARHSGPSIDRARSLRSLDEVARRGRWQSPASVQRYERHARLGQTEQSFSRGQRRVFDFAERHLEALVLGRIKADVLPSL